MYDFIGSFDDYSEYMWDCYERDLKEKSREDDCGMTLQDIEDDLDFRKSLEREQ